jgi:hypothetical protein
VTPLTDTPTAGQRDAPATRIDVIAEVLPLTSRTTHGAGDLP